MKGTMKTAIGIILLAIVMAIVEYPFVLGGIDHAFGGPLAQACK